MTTDTDDLLDRSAPRLPVPDELTLAIELGTLVGAARLEARASRRRGRRVVIAGATTAVLAVGGTAAAATVFDWVAPWAAAPTATATFALPSGGVCEERLGALSIPDPAAEALVRTWLGARPLEEVLGDRIEQALATLRADSLAGKNLAVDLVPGEKETPVGYGTDYYDADAEYVQAVDLAVTAAVRDKLAEMGYDGVEQFSWENEAHCSGTNPTPGVPWWQR